MHLDQQFELNEVCRIAELPTPTTQPLPLASMLPCEIYTVTLDAVSRESPDGMVRFWPQRFAFQAKEAIANKGTCLVNAQPLRATHGTQAYKNNGLNGSFVATSSHPNPLCSV